VEEQYGFESSGGLASTELPEIIER